MTDEMGQGKGAVLRPAWLIRRLGRGSNEEGCCCLTLDVGDTKTPAQNWGPMQTHKTQLQPTISKHRSAKIASACRLARECGCHGDDLHAGVGFL